MDTWTAYAILLLPVGIITCAIVAWFGTTIKIQDDCPTALKASFLTSNEAKSWNLK